MRSLLNSIFRMELFKVTYYHERVIRNFSPYISSKNHQILGLIFIFILFFNNNQLLSESDRSDSWLKTWEIGIGRGEVLYHIPSSLPIQRSFQDAWSSDRLFVPDYFKAIPLIPRYTGLTAETTSLKFGMESDLWGLIYFGLGIGYREYKSTEASLSAIQDRISLQTAIYSNLITLNQLRASTITSVYLQPYTSEYWVEINGRIPYWFWETSWFRPYAELGFGAGGCIRGESCNLTIYSAGMGMEFMRQEWNFVPYMNIEVAGINQQRIRRSLWAEESSFHIGIRHYR